MKKIVIILAIAALAIAQENTPSDRGGAMFTGSDQAPPSTPDQPGSSSCSENEELRVKLGTVIEEMMGNVSELNMLLSTIQDRATGEAAVDRLKVLLDRVDPIQSKLAALDANNPESLPVLLDLLQQNSARMQEIQDELSRNILRIVDIDYYDCEILRQAMFELAPPGDMDIQDIDEPDSEEFSLPKMPDEVLETVMSEAIPMMEELIGIFSSISNRQSADAAAPRFLELARRSDALFQKVHSYSLPEQEKMERFTEKLDELSSKLEELQDSVLENDFYGSEALEEAMSPYTS